MTLQEKITAHAGRLPENMQREVWAFIQSIESRGRQPGEIIDSSSEYLARYVPDEARDAMDRVMDRLAMDGVKDPVDPFVAAAARRVLDSSQW